MSHQEHAYIKHARLHAASINAFGYQTWLREAWAHLSPVRKAVEGQVVRLPARVPVLNVAPVFVERRAAARLDGRRRGRAAVLRRPRSIQGVRRACRVAPGLQLDYVGRCAAAVAAPEARCHAASPLHSSRIPQACTHMLTMARYAKFIIATHACVFAPITNLQLPKHETYLCARCWA